MVHSQVIQKYKIFYQLQFQLQLQRKVPTQDFQQAENTNLWNQSQQKFFIKMSRIQGFFD